MIGFIVAAGDLTAFCAGHNALATEAFKLIQILAKP
jgi:hypothetical protein